MRPVFFLVEDEDTFKALMTRAFDRDVKPQVWHAFTGDDITQIVNNIHDRSVTFINLIGSMIVPQFPFENTDPFQIDFGGGHAIVMYKKH